MSYSATVDATGITAPDFAAILAGLTAQYRAIYGEDVYLAPDSQDGATIAIFALAIHDTNSLAIAVYNNFSPATAQGEGLSRVVKINGIARKVPTYSKVDLLVGGQVGTIIRGGIVVDPSFGRWFIDADVVIPPSGQATASATFERPGAMAAPAGTLTKIGSPTRGWQTVTNPAAATLGAAVESDAALRVRQALSTALPSNTVLDGMVGTIAELPGVARLRAYENDTGTTDANGLPPHSISLVVDGGDPQAVANAIGAKKAPGVDTYGTTELVVVDVYSIPKAIAFFRPTVVPITATVTIRAMAGYSTAAGVAIQTAVARFINALPIAAAVRLARLYVPIDAVGTTFEVLSIALARDGGTAAQTDMLLAFNEAAFSQPEAITVTVVP